MRNSNLTILNAESLCKGLIIRSRKVNGVTEKSVLDYVIVCEKVRPFVTQFTIDEEKKYALSNYSSRGKVKHSDHNSIITDMTFKQAQLSYERLKEAQFSSVQSRLSSVLLDKAKSVFIGVVENVSVYN